MAMGKRKAERQSALWVPTSDLPTPPGHPFYQRLNAVLKKHGFEAFVEGLCQKFYAPVMGRPSIAPGLETVAEDPQAAKKLSERPARELVTEKGYHSNDTCGQLRGDGIRSYVCEPDRGRRNWKGKATERAAVYANRRRGRGERGKRLQRKRGEVLERGFAHAYDRGGMRRVHVRGRSNILKRLLVHIGGFNLSLVMRKLMGCGTARALQGGLFDLLDTAVHGLCGLWTAARGVLRHFLRPAALSGVQRPHAQAA